MASLDRIVALRAHADRFTGIDFVQVVEPCVQTTLRVFFHTDPRKLAVKFTNPAGLLTHDDVRIESTVPGGPEVLLDRSVPLVWDEDPSTGRPYLELAVTAPGGFVPYRLTIDDPYARSTPPQPPRIDRVFNGVLFSFQAGCPTGIDCADANAVCAAPAEEVPRIDYLARDFVSIRNALLDFLGQRHPDWTLPVEADVGVMFVELLAALGDELSYMQDRVAREAHLGTLTQRRSLRRLVRLVDYALHDGLTATTWLELEVKGVVKLAPGARVYALSDYDAPVAFEVSTFRDGPSVYPLRPAWNAKELHPYAWDEGERELTGGATTLDLEDAVDEAASLAGRPLLLKLDPADGVSEPKRVLLDVVRVELVRDELFERAVTRLHLSPDTKLPCGWPLAEVSASANLAFARAGETRSVYVRCGEPRPDDPPDLLCAVERAGPRYAQDGEREPFDLAPCIDTPGGEYDRPTIFLVSLPGTEQEGLGYEGDELRDAWPELRVIQIDALPAPGAPAPIGAAWEYVPSLLTEGASKASYTVEDGTYRRIVGYQVQGAEVVHRDYASGRGYTVRFGDNTFGRAPARDDLFHMVYRLGSGRRGNVPASTLRHLSAPGHVRTMPDSVVAVDNPFAVTNGVDPELASDAKMFAPEAFKATRHFALREQDYGDQLVEKLPWVQRAQGEFRWTGSWHTALVTADPVDAVRLSAAQRDEAERLLDCVRQAARDVSLRAPSYVDLDVHLTVCLEPWAYAGEVRPRLLAALVGRGATPGFFHPDFFTFGTPLRRSALEAAVQRVEGVRAVHAVRVRPRGQREYQPLTALTYDVPRDRVLRVDHDPSHPERGAVQLSFEGGA